MKAKSIWTMGAIAAIGVVLVAIIITIVVNSQKTTAPESQSNKASQEKTYKAPRACEVLSLGLAQKIDAGVTSNDTDSSDVSSNAISVSNCNYYNVATRVTVGLLVRAAKSDGGAKSNSDQFVALPSGSQLIEGYGDKAYWDPSFGQLNVLKNGNWYIISSGPVVARDRTLVDAKRLADIIANKL